MSRPWHFYWHPREIRYVLRSREALLDRIAAIAFCWSFKQLAKNYRGNVLPTTVGPDYADHEQRCSA